MRQSNRIVKQKISSHMEYAIVEKSEDLCGTIHFVQVPKWIPHLNYIYFFFSG